MGIVYCSYEVFRVFIVMKNFVFFFLVRGRESDFVRKCDGSGNVKIEFCLGKVNGKIVI